MTARDGIGLGIAITLAVYAAVGATVRIVAEIRRRRRAEMAAEAFRVYRETRGTRLIDENGDPR